MVDGMTEEKANQIWEAARDYVDNLAREDAEEAAREAMAKDFFKEKPTTEVEPLGLSPIPPAGAYILPADEDDDLPPQEEPAFSPDYVPKVDILPDIPPDSDDYYEDGDVFTPEAFLQKPPLKEPTKKPKSSPDPAADSDSKGAGGPASEEEGSGDQGPL
jgi:hypothetical protein